MVKTGELTGKLEACCRQLALQQKSQQQLSAKVKKALRYPLIILTLAVFVVLAMVTLVLPEFAAIYKTFNTRSFAHAGSHGAGGPGSGAYPHSFGPARGNGCHRL